MLRPPAWQLYLDLPAFTPGSPQLLPLRAQPRPELKILSCPPQVVHLDDHFVIHGGFFQRTGNRDDEHSTLLLPCEMRTMFTVFGIQKEKVE